MSNEKINLHKSHRQRLKNRFLRDGLSGFEPHVVLELLLFYAIPQSDTNELAHMLLNRFGSIAGVFGAPYEELIKIQGVGPHTATMLKLIPEVFGVYFKEKTSEYNKKEFSVDDVARYLIPLYITCEKEVVHALYFDNRMSLVLDEIVFEGDVNSAKLSIGDVAKCALTKNAFNVIIAHNHPNGTPIPSMEDNTTTLNFCNGLSLFGINLVEHIVIAGQKYTKILETLNMKR
ncbi:MAG: hypothetical protein E7588_07445 [Ruminococcaceae bacterium]|nr:hypothetical protein [Oscillospiraceae bacterium]